MDKILRETATDVDVAVDPQAAMWAMVPPAKRTRKTEQQGEEEAKTERKTPADSA